VHPSWRDLVIEQVAADDEPRRRFLAACGPTGILLALSAAGGEEGRRELPLLRADADWDVLAERLHALLGDLASDDLREVLLAITVATGTTSGAQRVEVLALGEQLLGWIARRWRAHPREVTVELLAAWLELAEQVPEAPETPHLEAALLELAPTADLDLARLEDIERLDDWLWLVALGKRRRPQDLECVGYPERYLPDLRAVLQRASSAPGEHHDRLLRID
jgi:hypothetical protein